MQKFGSGDFDVVCGQCGISLSGGRHHPVRLSAGAGSESRKYDGDGALDGGIRFIASGGEAMGGSGAVETGWRRHWHALHWRLPPEKGGIDGCGSWRGGSVCLE